MTSNLKIHKFNPATMENRRLRGSPPTCVFIGKRGSGKCLGKNTPILMYDGSIKMVQDISIGDKVMGDDSCARTVLALSSGESKMYKVVQKCGDDYIVNENHVLSLTVVTNEPIYIQGKRFLNGDVVDIPILECIKCTKVIENLRGYKVPVDFPEKNTPVDPYLFGSWLGNTDKNLFHDCIGPRNVPDIYKINSRKVRVEVLAGIIDAYFPNTQSCTNGFYEMTLGNGQLVNDIQYIAQSLGFMCSITIHDSNQNDKARFTVLISGGIVPCTFYQNKNIDESQCSKQCSKQCSEISIELLGEDQYYGFEVDGNHRFLLGDFTVTHNSTLISDIMYYHRTVPYGVIMSGTEDGNGFYGKYFPDLFIHSEFKSEALEKLIKQQKKCVKEENDPKRGHVFLLIDDLMYDKKMIRDKNMRQIFMNGRHWRILFFLSMQYCMDLPPDMRTNIDFVFLLRENIVANQMKLWKNFCGIFPTFQSFQETFTACTENYECLVLDNTSKSNKIEDCVFWYKGVQDREYRIGSKQLWDFAKTHYNKNYDKEENESAVSEPIKKPSGLNIIKKGF